MTSVILIFSSMESPGLNFSKYEKLYSLEKHYSPENVHGIELGYFECKTLPHCVGCTVSG
jgi:hypothetical protein